jgi:cellobiose epimerase
MGTETPLLSLAGKVMDGVALRMEMISDLTGNILPYWINKMTDQSNGGFYGRRDGYDVLDVQADKGVILNTRILWTFSNAVNVFSDAGLKGVPATKQYQDTADRAYTYLMKHFTDQEKGGVYWMVDYKGKPVSTKKQIYAQAFAMYALSEYFLMSQKEEALKAAIQLFYLVEQYSFDANLNGYYEAFDRHWNLLTDLRLSDKDANEKKTMNTHLHVLEAYTNLYRCWKDPLLKKQLHNLLYVFRDKILDEKFHFQLFFDEQWTVKSHEISFGHDIEGSWLLYEAAAVLGNEDLLEEMKILSVKIADAAIREGMDNDGGLMNEGGHKGVCDTDKHWWPQAEAIVGLANAWQITGDAHYLAKAERVWQFIREYLIDKENGEWHWRVSRSGNVYREEDKAGAWKCPYHNGRAALEIMKRL